MSVSEYLFLDQGLPAPFTKINIMKTDSNFFMAAHSHSFYHVNRVLSGSLTVTLGDKKYEVGTGCIFVLPPDVPHALMSESGYIQIGTDLQADNDTRGLVREIERLRKDFLIVRQPLSAQQAKDQLQNMRRLLTTPTITNVMRAINISELLVLDLIDGIGNPQRETFLERFTEMVSFHEPWALTLAYMCQYLSLSRTQLELKAHQTFGCGAAEYCARLRYAYVCELLQTNRTLESIASETGFYDACHLSKFFTARAGLTPGQYRKSLGL